MLRDKSLIPLSHQHQRALALCVRIDRAQPIPAADLQAWQAEIEQQFEQEIKIHFSVEEQLLFPAARKLPELIPLVEELIADHGTLRESFSQGKDPQHVRENPACIRPTPLRPHSQRRTPALRALAAVDEPAGTGRPWERRWKLLSKTPRNPASCRTRRPN